MASLSSRTLRVLALIAGLGVGTASLPAHAAQAEQVGSHQSAGRSARPTAGPTVGKVDYRARGQLAAEWQATQLRNGRMPSGYPGYPDWGLTIDTAFMLAADGSQPAVLAQVKQAIAGHITDYAVYMGDTASGAMSKVLVAVEVLKGEPTDFGGINVRGRVLKLVAPAGAGFEHGRLRDTGDTDYSNTLGQSFATIGLARSGHVAQPVVDYLLKQRCADGYFRLTEVVGQTCDEAASDPDVDATALALQALLAAQADGAEVAHSTITRTVGWLLSVQHDDGSFGGGVSTPSPNANSTGLAAQALAGAGRPSARLRAAAWVAGVQLTRANAGEGPAKPDIGAIAYDPETLRDGIANGLGDSRAKWWRSTPQGFFAFVPVPLGTLTAP